jgi:hypothetical protein
MIQLIDDRLRDEARRFRLVFACPDCAAYDPEGDRCSLGFPNEPHRERSLADREEIIFCKAFELT